jgi:hypothetical protein
MRLDSIKEGLMEELPEGVKLNESFFDNLASERRRIFVDCDRCGKETYVQELRVYYPVYDADYDFPFDMYACETCEEKADMKALEEMRIWEERFEHDSALLDR